MSGFCSEFLLYFCVTFVLASQMPSLYNVWGVSRQIIMACLRSITLCLCDSVTVSDQKLQQLRDAVTKT